MNLQLLGFFHNSLAMAPFSLTIFVSVTISLPALLKTGDQHRLVYEGVRHHAFPILAYRS